MKASREEVYDALDSERDYQDRKWGSRASSNRPGDGSRTLDEFALYLSVYADKLRALAGEFADPAPKLDVVRKVGALAVACMEQHGALLRRESVVKTKPKPRPALKWNVHDLGFLLDYVRFNRPQQLFVTVCVGHELRPWLRKGAIVPLANQPIEGGSIVEHGEAEVVSITRTIVDEVDPFVLLSHVNPDSRDVPGLLRTLRRVYAPDQVTELTEISVLGLRLR